MIKHIILTVLLLTAALASPALCQTTPAQASAPSSPPAPATDANYAAMVQRYQNAKWTFAAGDHMADLYPPNAQSQGMGGMAKIACVIDPDGHLNRCAVVDESPAGYGFGEATAIGFVRYTRVDPATVTGGIQPGDIKVFVYKWVLN